MTFYNNTLNTRTNNGTVDLGTKSGKGREEAMVFFHSVIASIGIVANTIVIVVFLNHKQFKCKVQNKFIINQVIVFNVLNYKISVLFKQSLTIIFCSHCNLYRLS